MDKVGLNLHLNSDLNSSYFPCRDLQRNEAYKKDSEGYRGTHGEKEKVEKKRPKRETEAGANAKH